MQRITTAIALTTLATPALAAIPPMPGMTSGLGMPGNGMIHAEIAVQNNAVSATLRTMTGADASAVTLIAGLAPSFDPPYDVLSDQLYNAQLGWLEDQTLGFTPIDIPLDAAIAITLLTVQGPGFVSTYEGGTGGQLTTTGHTMTPIHTTSGSPASWLWDDDFAMQHNWITFPAPGDYVLTYDIAVTNPAGEPLTTYTSAQLTVRYTALPEPASALLLVLPLLNLRRPRR